MKMFIALYDRGGILAEPFSIDEKQTGKEKFVFPISNPKNKQTQTSFDDPLIKLYFQKGKSCYDIKLPSDCLWGADNMTGTGWAGTFNHSSGIYNFKIVGEARAKRYEKPYWNLEVEVIKNGEMVIDSDFLPEWEKS